MTPEIKTINFGGINCYLVKTDTGYILIDTGFPAKRTDLGKELKVRAASLEISSSS